MKCPIDGATLTMTQRNGVEIDYCPSCRGVWLDRGELDKIIDRVLAETTPPVALAEPARAAHPDERRDSFRAPHPETRPAPRPESRPESRAESRHEPRYEGRYRDDDDDDRDNDRRPRKKRRESFLSDLFDF